MVKFEYAMLREVYLPANNGTFGFNFEGPSGPGTVSGTNPIEALNSLGQDGWELAGLWVQIVDKKATTIYTFKRPAKA